MNDFKTALAAAWVIVSAVLFLLAIVPFVAPAEWLYRAAPVCEAKRRGESCVLCGMTTAYVAIGSTDWQAARRANAGALPLWGGSLANFSGAVAYVSIALHKRRGR